MPDEHADELAAFIHQEHRRLVGLLALQVGRVAVAEELAQDALTRLCEHWPRVRRMANRRGWLNRVAINLANSWWRRRYAERRANRRHGPEQSVVEPQTTDVVAVREAVSALPPRQRTVIALRFYEQLSVAETAELMGCAQGTVKSLTHKAVSRLRTHADLIDEERANA